MRPLDEGRMVQVDHWDVPHVHYDLGGALEWLVWIGPSLRCELVNLPVGGVG